MLSFLHLNSFKFYNLILLFVFSTITNSFYSIEWLHPIFYCFFHLLLIYLAIYHYTKLLYPIYFLYGLALDIYLLNEIGPHLLSFILSLFLINLYSKYLYNLTSLKVYILIIILLLIMILFEFSFSNLVFNLDFKTKYYFKLILISTTISFPVFLLFSKIDKFK